MANENKTAKEYVQKGYLIAHLANCGIRTINYDEWERLCECVHEAKPADVVDRNECSKCVLHPFKQLREQLETNVVEVVKCKDCKHRIVNEHYGEKGYMKLKAICDKDTGDPFELGRNAEDDEWFCADAERREDELHKRL